MSKNPPSLGQIVAVVQSQLLPKRERDPRGRQASYSDEFIIGLVIFERVWGFASSKKMLALLDSMGEQLPAAATFCERKQNLIGLPELAVLPFQRLETFVVG